MTKRRKRGHKKELPIAKDAEMVVQLVKEILEIEGFEVEVASDGVEGLEKIKQIWI
jgi:DNA-binding response OmpR family regulator